jgi:hypothetical protein
MRDPKILLDIHVEGVARERFLDGDPTHLLRDIKYIGIPVVLSLPPFLEDYWRKENPRIIDLVSEIVTREGNLLGQQGNLHECRFRHKFVDPWHENFCFYNRRLSEAEQRDLMEAGRARLEKLTGVKATWYVAPNHQFDATTLRVANIMGYGFFADKAAIALLPYKFGNLIVVPEGDLRKGDFRSSAVYIHLDEMDAHSVYSAEALRRAMPVAELCVRNVSAFRKHFNSVLKYGPKVARDIGKLSKQLIHT